MVMLRSAMKALHSGRYSQWHPMSRNEDPHAASGASLSTALLGFLAFLAGATVANLYYIASHCSHASPRVSISHRAAPVS